MRERRSCRAVARLLLVDLGRRALGCAELRARPELSPRSGGRGWMLRSGPAKRKPFPFSKATRCRVWPPRIGGAQNGHDVRSSKAKPFRICSAGRRLRASAGSRQGLADLHARPTLAPQRQGRAWMLTAINASNSTSTSRRYLAPVGRVPIFHARQRVQFAGGDWAGVDAKGVVNPPPPLKGTHQTRTPKLNLAFANLANPRPSGVDNLSTPASPVGCWSCTPRQIRPGCQSLSPQDRSLSS